MLRLLSFTAILCLFYGKAAALIFTDSTAYGYLGTQMSILRSDRELSFAEVQQSHDFVMSERTVPNMGISSSSIWFKLDIRNDSPLPKLILKIDNPLLDEVELFYPGSGTYHSMLNGENVPYSLREYKSTFLVFVLDIPQGEGGTYYLRVKSREQIIFPVSLMQAQGLFFEVTRETTFLGIYIGIILIMGLYNLFLYLAIKDTSYLFYVIYVFFVGLTQTGIEGVTYKFLWPEYPVLQAMSVQIFACISGAAALLFTMYFLRIRRFAPRLNRVFHVLLSAFVVAGALTLMNYQKWGFLVMQTTTLVGSLWVLSISYYVMQKGYRPAKFFFAAWIILIISSIVFLLKDYDLLPYNNLTRNVMKIGSAIEIALLSFGLADRINRLKKERSAIKNMALKTAQENARIVKMQNVLLEEKVIERTEELSSKNEALNEAIEGLKEAQAQLVASEKMASLGHFTAGIAHEINNPINFVAANVLPLQRDVRLLLDTISKIEEVHAREGTTAEKERQIAAFKEEHDLDYVKMEIQHLLKGINEGASRTAAIVKSLRSFSRLDDDTLKFADVNEGLDSTLLIINHLLHDIKVTTNWGELAAVYCYPGKLNQVFLNIISNAIFAIQKQHGQGGGHLQLDTYEEAGAVWIRITDNGTGMDEETIKKIYEPFFTTKEIGEGTGLGMSIVYTIIQKHNGDILIDSTPGEGTQFTVRIPINGFITETGT